MTASVHRAEDSK